MRSRISFSLGGIMDKDLEQVLNNKLSEILKTEEEVEEANGFLEALGALMQLDDEDFILVSPLIREKLNDILNEPSVKVKIIDNMRANGAKIEDVSMMMTELSNSFDEEAFKEFSQVKRDFLKMIINDMCSILESMSDLPSRTIRIPIEICNENAKMPKYANDGDAAMDLFCPEEVTIEPGETKLIELGFKLQLPEGYAMLIQPRSGLSKKTKLRIPNTPGLCDSGYRGVYGVIVENTEPKVKDITFEYDDEHNLKVTSITMGSPITIGKGERFAQMRLVEVPTAVLFEIDQVNETNRSKGFGDSGKF